jgi:hypothetical protein
MDGKQHAPAALPSGKTRYPLYKRLDGRVLKISPHQRFDQRTVLRVASRYTDRAIPIGSLRAKNYKMIDTQLAGKVLSFLDTRYVTIRKEDQPLDPKQVS